MSKTVDIRVWAPFANSVDCVLKPDGPGEYRISMNAVPEEVGYWHTNVPSGSDYLLSVNGGRAFPDPHSRYQPHGVHGPSRAIDLGFEWTDNKWTGGAEPVRSERGAHSAPRSFSALGALWYELHIGTFTPEGTLDAAITRLPHLQDLGVGVVELMPVAGFPGERGWGYDGVNLSAVHRAYGGPRALQRFVDSAHNLGIAVALDVVYNHLGPSGNYLSQFGPYLTDRYHTPWGEAVNLDGKHSEQVRRFFLDNARQWFFDFHIDALRLDAVHALTDRGPRHFLAELSDAREQWEHELGRPLALIAESDLNDVKILRATDHGGYGMDGQWNDDFHHAMHSYLTGETFGYYCDFGSAQVLADVMKNVFFHRGGYSTFRGMNWGASVPEDMDRERFVVFTQGHDQVGNRALGDRPDERLTAGTVLCGAALMLLGPFTPLLFQGQEWGTTGRFQFFTDHGDDIGPWVKEGRVKEFSSHGWEDLYDEGFEVPDPQSEQTFLDSKLDWAELDANEHQAVFSAYRHLVRLRELVRGDRYLSIEYAEKGTEEEEESGGSGFFAMHRSDLSVISHPGEGSSTHDVEGSEIAWQYGDVHWEGATTLQLGAHSVVVLRHVRG